MKNSAVYPRDVLLAGGTVIPMSSGGAPAAAVALRGDRIVGVGSEEELRPLLATNATRIDVEGATVLPGFHDSHVHLTQHGFETSQVNLLQTTTVDEALGLLAEAVQAAGPGEWILGSGFALDRWGLSSVHRRLLDRIAPRNPVFLRSQDHHSAWVNSLALELAGVDEQAVANDDEVLKDGEGRPSGHLLERSVDLVSRVLPRPDAAAIRAALDVAAADLAARGVTTVHHMAYESVDYWRQLALVASRDEYPLRVWACIDQELAENAAAVGLATGQGGGNFEIGGAKFFADGALGSRTAWMLEPYRGTEGRGVTVHGPDVLKERFPAVIEAGFVPVIHAIGDAAAAAVIDALEVTEASWQAAGLRPRLEHAQHMRESDVERLARLGVVASVQPLHMTFDAPVIRAMLGDREERAYRIRHMLDLGVCVPFGSDTPVTLPDVIGSLRAAVDRIGVDGRPLNGAQAISPREAVAGYTSMAAQAIGREGRSGILVPGYDADLVLMEGNPVQSLEGARVKATVKGGVATYDPDGLLVALATG